MMRRWLGAAISLGVLGAPLIANAEVSVYAGAEAGYTDIGLEELDDDQHERVFVGFMFTPSWGLEASTGSLGNFENGRPRANSSVDVPRIEHVAFMFEGQLIENLSAYAKAGGYKAQIEPDIPNGTAEDMDSNGFTYGAGLAYEVVDHVALTASWQYYHQLEDVNFATYSLGARIKF